MLAAGTRLGPYEVLAPLGAGGMGEVYRAHDSRLGRDVAIKVLPSHLSATPEARARFEREARTISQLNHARICTLHDVGHQDGIDYLVMELLEGETLGARLEKGPMPVAEALMLGRQIAEALERAHRAGVAHRDLKPGNVMLTKAGAKLMDFGLARTHAMGAAPGTMSQSPTVTRPLTAEGTIVGTFQYMAPEQLEGKDVDSRSDLWALGCVLYEMVTGQRAFAGESQASLIAAIMTGDPRAMTELRPLAPAALERVVRRCLQKDPDARFQNASDLAFALEGVSGSSSGSIPITAGTPADRLNPVAQFGEALGQPAAVPALARSRVAVLPFQNLNADTPNAYFAGALHDELLTQLAKVVGLKTISRTSVMGYAGTAKPVKQIGAELAVGSIVEGSVQVAGNRLRVNIQLIDVATDEHLWAERYDRTLDDAFAIQSEVAQQVVAAVGPALASGEQRKLAIAPTANAEAYRLYLQGRDYDLRPGRLRQDLETAQQLYERALTLDPAFALAHAALSQLHGRIYWFRFDHSTTRAARQREEAEAALRLAPDVPEVHIAMGLSHYWGRRDYRQALKEFAIALEGMPGNARLWISVGMVHRRLGNWSEALVALDKAAQLDPRDAVLFDEMGSTYQMLRRYDEAVRAFNRALDLAPDLYHVAINRGWTYVRWQGRLDELRTSLDEIPRDALQSFAGAFDADRAVLLLLERNADRLLEVVRRAGVDVFENQHQFLPVSLYAAWAHQLRGDQAAAQGAFDSASLRLDSALRQSTDDARMHSARGLALAGLGRRGEALREASWLQQSADYLNDAFGGRMVAEDLAQLLAQAGEADSALNEIEKLLGGPSTMTVHTLRLDPRWDPLREHPRFQSLMEKYANPEAK